MAEGSWRGDHDGPTVGPSCSSGFSRGPWRGDHDAEVTVTQLGNHTQCPTAPFHSHHPLPIENTRKPHNTIVKQRFSSPTVQPLHTAEAEQPPILLTPGYQRAQGRNIPIGVNPHSDIPRAPHESRNNTHRFSAEFVDNQRWMTLSSSRSVE
jgi:hypothetical protein